MGRFLHFAYVLIGFFNFTEGLLSLTNGLCSAFQPCLPGFQCINYRCVQPCPPCSFVDPLYGFCRSRCGQYEACFNGQCICPPGFCKFGPFCRPFACGIVARGECSDDVHCPQNERCIDNKCICEDCASRDQYGVCQSRCKEEEECKRDRCTCKRGFCRVNNKCIPCQCRIDKDCPGSETCKHYRCECRECERRDKNGRCGKLCGVDEECVRGQCKCRKGYCSINNLCKPCDCRNNNDCPNGEHCINYRCKCGPCERRDGSGKCRSACGNNENCVNGKCDCRPKFCKVHGACKRCGCKNNYECGTNEVCKNYNCQCRDCYKRNSFGRCTNDCGKYEICSGGSCVCTKGYCKKNGICKPCSGSSSRSVGTHSSRRDDTILRPKDGKFKPKGDIFKHKVDGCTDSATCPYDEVCLHGRCKCQSCQRRESSGRCQPICMGNETCQRDRCFCASGYCRKGNKCLKCE